MTDNASELTTMKTGEAKKMDKTPERIRLKGGGKPISHKPSQ